jgi:hypothetical protein
MTIDDELDWWEQYKSASVADQRRGMFGRRYLELLEFARDHGHEYDDIQALGDAAWPTMSELLAASLGLIFNVAEGEQ